MLACEKGRILNRSVLDDVERSLTDEYFAQGKYAASVKAEVKDLPGNMADININIKEGDRARIRQINIVAMPYMTIKRCWIFFSYARHTGCHLFGRMIAIPGKPCRAI